jgi:hypothetical protein
MGSSKRGEAAHGEVSNLLSESGVELSRKTIAFNAETTPDDVENELCELVESGEVEPNGGDFFWLD